MVGKLSKISFYYDELFSVEQNLCFGTKVYDLVRALRYIFGVALSDLIQ